MALFGGLTPDPSPGGYISSPDYNLNRYNITPNLSPIICAQDPNYINNSNQTSPQSALNAHLSPYPQQLQYIPPMNISPLRSPQQRSPQQIQPPLQFNQPFQYTPRNYTPRHQGGSPHARTNRDRSQYQNQNEWGYHYPVHRRNTQIQYITHTLLEID